MAKRITATTAARRLSDVLDDVEHSGDEFVVERHGRAVATIAPLRAGGRRATIGDLIRTLESLPRIDPDFARDLAEIRRRQPKLRTRSWPSSSTRRS